MNSTWFIALDNNDGYPEYVATCTRCNFQRPFRERSSANISLLGHVRMKHRPKAPR